MEATQVILADGKLTTIQRGDQFILSDLAKHSFTVLKKLPNLLESIFVFDTLAGGAVRVYDQNGTSHIFSSERFIKIVLDESCVILKPLNPEERKYLHERLEDSIYFAEYNDEYNLFVFPESQDSLEELASELDQEFNYGNYIAGSQGFWLSTYPLNNTGR
jgi:hypothetical protein